MKQKKNKKKKKKTRERAHYMSVQNKEHTGTVVFFVCLFFVLSGNDSCCLKCIIICSMYDSCN